MLRHRVVDAIDLMAQVAAKGHACSSGKPRQDALSLPFYDEDQLTALIDGAS
ncbi:hypothetical protein PsexTeo8_22300 [Pseudomonas extremaustralis]|uniref:hypothetical protein n=1 Tax=Pseudomonas extremaustralis TaxID=359110 RepID=UPI002AA0CBBD|nr:hypothetical protein [Pseudomonas extremaustralis]MDY7065782.1 hypothetical protein [Pseudomonas extremaustralis]